MNEEMMIVMKHGASAQAIEQVKKQVESLGLKASESRGDLQTIIGVVGDARKLSPARFSALGGVQEVLRIAKPFKLASREFRKEPTVVKLGNGVSIGGEELALIAGPCSVESREQLLETAIGVKEAGATVLRASIFKPRTSPYDFQGIGVKGLHILEEVKQETGMLLETEVMHTDQVRLVEPVVDVLRIGARNMQNFDLLKEAGRSELPVILKRGPSATVHEFLLAAEYILNEGNSNVILCERGIRTFVTETRNTLDLNCVPLIKGISHLPIIVDPSHGTGKVELVAPMSRAAIACGADGLIIEVHRNPLEALSDASQQLTLPQFKELVREVVPVAKAVGRKMGVREEVRGVAYA